MKKVINITVGQIVFAIEEDAYEKLSAYLDAIKKHFAKDKDREEILEDIEVGIAEKFVKRKNKSLAISAQDVENVIVQMGTVHDFQTQKDEEEEDEAKKEESFGERFRSRFRNKKLYRNPDDVIISGVASGVAAYLGVEPVLIRLAFFITIFFGGLGLLIYIFLWIVLPVAETTEQKFEMRGGKVTLQEIERAVKEGVDKLKKKDFSKMNGSLSRFAKGVGNVLSVALRIIVKLVRVAFQILGVMIVIMAVAAICALSFGLAWSVGGLDLGGNSIALNQFVNLSYPIYWVFALSLYFSVLMPTLLILHFGLSIAKMRSTLSLFGLLSLFVIWFISLGFAGSVIFENRFLIRDKINEIEIIEEYKSNRFFEDCVNRGGQWGWIEGENVCDFEGGSFEGGFEVGDQTCQTPSECQAPGYVRSSCFYEAACENNTCMLHCPIELNPPTELVEPGENPNDSLTPFMENSQMHEYIPLTKNAQDCMEKGGQLWVVDGQTECDLEEKYAQLCAEKGGSILIEDDEFKCELGGSFMNEFFDEAHAPKSAATKMPGEACQFSSECQLPAEYIIKSACAYEAICENNACTVHCPWRKNDLENQETLQSQ